MSWRTGGCALALTLALGVLGTQATAAPTTATPAPRATVPSATPDHVDLTDDYVVPGGRDGVRPRVRRWPGTRIRYYETIPAKWHWGLYRAIDHWNRSGARMKFVKVASRRKAQLVIRYGDTGGADGVATLGPTRNAYVHLSPAYKQADPDNALTRVWVGRLFAHELGHVLGFDHTGGSCSLMYPVFDMGLCPLLSDQKAGYYLRRWIDRPLLRRYIGTYGGSARRPPRLGLVAPLPPQLTDVRFAGGQAEDRPVTISWRPPSRVAEGTRVRILAWQQDSCAGGPPDGFFEQYERKPGAGRWTDPEFGVGTWCYRVQVENRYGAARPAITRPVARWTPVPDAPDIALEWDEAQGVHTFDWATPTGTTLVVQRDQEDPGNCLTAYDEDTAGWLFPDEGDTYSVSPRAQRECLVFFAVTDWGTVSAPTTVVAEVPALAATPTVGQVALDPDDPWSMRVTASVDDRYRLGVELLPGPCPATPPADAGWWDGWETAPGQWQLSPDAPGPNCALFTAVDESFWSFVRHGPVVAREFTWTAPS